MSNSADMVKANIVLWVLLAGVVAAVGLGAESFWSTPVIVAVVLCVVGAVFAAWSGEQRLAGMVKLAEVRAAAVQGDAGRHLEALRQELEGQVAACKREAEELLAACRREGEDKAGLVEAHQREVVAEVVRVLSELNAGHLDTRVAREMHDDVGDVAVLLDKYVEKVQGVTVALEMTADALVAAAESLTDTSNHLGASADETHSARATRCLGLARRRDCRAKLVGRDAQHMVSRTHDGHRGHCEQQIQRRR